MIKLSLKKVNWVWGNQWEETFFKEGRLALILSLCEGGVEINFWLNEGGYDLVLGHISPISQRPLKVIIAQSLISVQNCSNTPPPLLNLPCILYLVAEFSRAQSARSWIPWVRKFRHLCIQETLLLTKSSVKIVAGSGVQSHWGDIFI